MLTFISLKLTKVNNDHYSASLERRQRHKKTSTFFSDTVIYCERSESFDSNANFSSKRAPETSAMFYVYFRKPGKHDAKSAHDGERYRSFSVLHMRISIPLFR